MIMSNEIVNIIKFKKLKNILQMKSINIQN